jgi:histidinol phosphatase-like enzyme
LSLYILDTDHLSLILSNHPQVTANAAQHQIAISIVTLQELFNGWMGMFHPAAQDFHLDLAKSYLVGDKLTDIQTGNRADR